MSNKKTSSPLKNGDGFKETVMRDRIVELRRVPASELHVHPQAYRIHSDHQKHALQAMIGEIGFVDAVIAREVDGELELLDGVLRKDVAGGETIPVLIVDLDDTEARQMLATFDPIGELASVDEGIFATLLEDVQPLMAHGDIRTLLGQIHDEAVEAETKGEASDHYVPGMELETNEHYDYVVVLARDVQVWNVLCTRLGLRPSLRRNRVGVGRGFPAEKLVQMLGDDDGSAKP